MYTASIYMYVTRIPMFFTIPRNEMFVKVVKIVYRYSHAAFPYTRTEIQRAQ